MINSGISFRLTIILLIINTSLLAQSEFLPGSITKRNGATEEVIIKMSGWKNNPYFIEYKTKGSEEIITGKLEDIESFEVLNKAKYVRADVAFDRSSDLQGQLSRVREPLWESETLFLKVLVDSEILLLSHKTARTTRFYYKKPDGIYEPLVYKKYNLDQRLKHNREYKKQIQDNFSCGYSIEKLRNLAYKGKDLIALFTSINECLGNEVKILKPQSTKSATVWSFQPGLNLFSGSTTKSIPPSLRGRRAETYNADTESHFSIRFGFEGEYMIPKSINKWAFFFGTAFTSFKAEGRWDDVLDTSNSSSTLRGSQNWEINVNSINFILGMRRFIRLNDKSMLFFSLGWQPGINLDFGSEIQVSSISGVSASNGSNLTPKQASNVIAGFGGQFRNLTLEVRYNTKRELFRESDQFKFNYQGLSVVLGLRFAKKPID